MAKNKRHIDLELKTKLGAHEVPVMESEWTAFETFRNKKESKRRRFIYLIAAALVFIAVSGMLVWKIQDAKRNNQIENNLSEKQNPVQPSEEHIATPDQKANPENLESGGTQSGTPGTEPGTSGTKPGTSNTGTSNKGTSNTGSGSPAESQDITTPERQKGKEVEPGTLDQPGFTPEITPPLSVTPFVFRFPAPQLPWTEIPVVTAQKSSNDTDTGKTLPGKNEKKFMPISTPSLAFGLAYGFGNPALTVENNDTTQTHRQYEQTLKGAKQNSQVFRMFLQYEYRLKFGLEFGAGLQFTSQTQVQRYNFQLREIPYLGPNGDIWFYIIIPPNQPVTPTVFESRQNIYTASVPLSLGYVHKLGTNFRLGMRAQGSLGMNWSKDFIGLSPKTLSETTVRANVNPLNLSYGGGLFGEYFYLDKWSARLSVDWTAQNKQFKVSNGYNITNRYYEFKLALVRYL